MSFSWFRSSPSLVSDTSGQVESSSEASESSPQSLIRVMAGRCTHVAQFGTFPVPCPCKAGIFDVALSHPTGPESESFVLFCNACYHPASNHESVPTDSSLSDEQSQSVRNHSTTGILQHPVVASQDRSGAPAIIKPFNSEAWCQRRVVVERIVSRLFKHRILLLRGTPGCGKTVLRRLIHQVIRDQYPDVNIYVFRGWPPGMDMFQSQDFLETSTGVSHYYDDSLWGGFLKSLQPPSGAVVLLLSAYGSAAGYVVNVPTGTPPLLGPNQRISLRWSSDEEDEPEVGLLLRSEEAYDLIKKSCEFGPNSHDQLSFSSELCQYLVTISGGHAGALSALVDVVRDDTTIKNLVGRAGIRRIVELGDFMIAFGDDPTGTHLRSALSRKRFARGLPQWTDVQVNNGVADVLSIVAKSQGSVAASAFTSHAQQGLDISYKKGWLHKTRLEDGAEGYRFASPLHAWHCSALLLSREPTLGSITTPLELVLEIVKRFHPSKLNSPPRHPIYPNSQPPEDSYGTEFYRASENIVKVVILWSPEFGDLGKKAGGSIDFFLASEGWGFELVKEGSEIRKHYARFEDGGPYHRWITSGSLRDWLLLDFRTNKPTTPHPNMPNLVHICFNNRFQQVALLNNNLDSLGFFRLVESVHIS